MSICNIESKRIKEREKDHTIPYHPFWKLSCRCKKAGHIFICIYMESLDGIARIFFLLFPPFWLFFCNGKLLLLLLLSQSMVIRFFPFYFLDWQWEYVDIYTERETHTNRERKKKKCRQAFPESIKKCLHIHTFVKESGRDIPLFPLLNICTHARFNQFLLFCYVESCGFLILWNQINELIICFYFFSIPLKCMRKNIYKLESHWGHKRLLDNYRFGFLCVF